MSTREQLAEVIRDGEGTWRTPLEAADAILEAVGLEKYKRGAVTLGQIIDRQCRDALDVTGLHHLINEDGDGHWDVVWMRLYEMRDELADLKDRQVTEESIQQAKAEAWDEGYTTGNAHNGRRDANPYRSES